MPDYEIAACQTSTFVFDEGKVCSNFTADKKTKATKVSKKQNIEK